MPAPSDEELKTWLKDLERALGLAHEAMVVNPTYLLSPLLRELAGEAAKKALDGLRRIENYLRIDRP